MCKLLFLFSWLEDLKGTEERLVDAHHCASVIKLATVVWCRKECDELAFGKELVPVFNDLVGTADEVHVVFLEKARDHVRSKGKGHAAVVLAPPSDVFIRV